MRKQGRRGLVLAGAVVGILAGVAACTGVARWYVNREIPPPDPDLARREVQRYYDRKPGNRVVVERCSYAPSADSDYDNYDCVVVVRCPRPAQFSVPRATATLGRIDANARPNGRNGDGRRCPT